VFAIKLRKQKIDLRLKFIITESITEVLKTETINVVTKKPNPIEKALIGNNSIQ